MEIGALGHLTSSISNLELGQIKQQHNDSSNVESLFDSIFIRLLTQAAGIDGSDREGVLGLNGPWKDVIYTAINESLVGGNTIGMGRLLLDSINNQQNGENK